MTRLLLIGAAVLVGVAVNLSAAVAPTSQPAKPIVLVLQFTSPTGSDATWVGRAATDDLAAALKADLDATVKAPSVIRDVADTAAALDLAHKYHASFVIYGLAQEANTIARITGQVLDVKSGMPIGGLKVTGPATMILDIDDALTAQALASLPQTIVKPRALAKLQQQLIQLGGSDAGEPEVDGLAMVSQSYPVGSTTFIPSIMQDAPVTQNVSYIYAPTIIVSPGYGYGGAYAPDYYGPLFAYPAIINFPHRHDHGPVIHHGPQRPNGFASNGNAGIVIGGTPVAGDAGGGATFSWGQNAGPVSTPFMGGGQSFPVQNGFFTSGAGAGYSVFTGPRFSNTPNLARGGRGGR